MSVKDLREQANRYGITAGKARRKDQLIEKILTFSEKHQKIVTKPLQPKSFSLQPFKPKKVKRAFKNYQTLKLPRYVSAQYSQIEKQQQISVSNSESTLFKVYHSIIEAQFFYPYFFKINPYFQEGNKDFEMQNFNSIDMIRLFVKNLPRREVSRELRIFKQRSMLRHRYQTSLRTEDFTEEDKKNLLIGLLRIEKQIKGIQPVNSNSDFQRTLETNLHSYINDTLKYNCEELFRYQAIYKIQLIMQALTNQSLKDLETIHKYCHIYRAAAYRKTQDQKFLYSLNLLKSKIMVALKAALIAESKNWNIYVNCVLSIRDTITEEELDSAIQQLIQQLKFSFEMHPLINMNQIVKFLDLTKKKVIDKQLAKKMLYLIEDYPLHLCIPDAITIILQFLLKNNEKLSKNQTQKLLINQKILKGNMNSKFTLFRYFQSLNSPEYDFLMVETALQIMKQILMLKQKQPIIVKTYGLIYRRIEQFLKKRESDQIHPKLIYKPLIDRCDSVLF